jgi:hypothetical protein
MGMLIGMSGGFRYGSSQVIWGREGWSSNRFSTLPSPHKDLDSLLRSKRSLYRKHPSSEQPASRLLPEQRLIRSRIDRDRPGGMEAVQDPPLAVAHGVLFAKEASVLRERRLVGGVGRCDDGEDRLDVLGVEDDGGDSCNGGEL